MLRLFFMVLAGLFLLSSLALADTVACPKGRICAPYAVAFLSTSPQRSYGLLVKVPVGADCAVVRFRARTATQRVLGSTQPLIAGEVAVLPLGRGFAPGWHDVSVASSGCALHPALARRVLLGRVSPDHSWRTGVIPTGG